MNITPSQALKFTRNGKFFHLQVSVHLDLARKIELVSEKVVAKVFGVGNLSSEIEFMPSQHSPDKINVSVWVDRALHARLFKEAKARKFSHLTNFLEYLYAEATRHVTLSPQELRKIADDAERARHLRQTPHLRRADDLA